MQVSQRLKHITGYFIFIIIVHLCTQSILGQTIQDQSSEQIDRTSEKLKAAVELYSDAVTRGDLVGAVVCVFRKGEYIVNEAFGSRDIEGKLPMEKDTRFLAASMTKPVIATAILKLVEQGKLSLDDPVSKFLPAFKEGLSNAIKIRHLLSHTSGLRINQIYLQPYSKPTAEYPDAPTLISECSRFAGIGPDSIPGTSYAYSNPGYNILGAIVEVAGGKPLAGFLADEIHHPLGMTSTQHINGDLIDFSDVAKVYLKQEGNWIPYKLPRFPIIVPAGSMVTTAKDLVRFCRMFLKGDEMYGTTVLKKESIVAATTAKVKAKYIYPSPEDLEVRRFGPRWHFRRDGRDLGIDTGYGYGWVISADGTICHPGALGTFMWIDAKRELVGIILTNSVGGANPALEFIDLINAAIDSSSTK